MLALQQWETDHALVERALRKLLAGGPTRDDPLPCLKAIRRLASADKLALSTYGAPLQQLVQMHGNNIVDLRAIDAAIERLERSDAQVPPPQPGAFTPIEPVIMVNKTESQPRDKRMIPGLTRLVQPSPTGFPDRPRLPDAAKNDRGPELDGADNHNSLPARSEQIATG